MKLEQNSHEFEGLSAGNPEITLLVFQATKLHRSIKINHIIQPSS